MKHPDDFTPAPDASRAPTELDLEREGETPGPAATEPKAALASSAVGRDASWGAVIPTLPEGRLRAPVKLRQVTLTNPQAGNAAASLPATADAFVGFVIDERYQIEELLAKGGMGVVYRARHRIIDKPVAIKILRAELVNNREITQRFLTEAQAASSIGSEHIVDVTDYGELPDGATYIVMEYLHGVSLSDLIDGQQLSVKELLAIARQLAEGLARAHEAHIIHRDLKPDNVLLVPRGSIQHFVKILDFGIAKVASSQNHITRAGKVFGTPHYMSPEQAGGTPQDHRTDIYSLGVILFQMCSRRLPFEGENPLGILTQHLYTEPPQLADVCDHPIPAGLEAVIAKCMSKKPHERYASVIELDDDLERLQRFVPPRALYELQQRESLPSSLRKRLRKATKSGRLKRMATNTGTVALVAVALWGSASWFSRSRDGRTSPELNHTDRPSLIPPQSPARAESDYHVVALVLSPYDAHVYSKGRDLGMMPINIRLRKGQAQSLQVRRDGYVPQTIRVDDSERRRVVQLTPLSGVITPPVPALPPDGGTAVRTITLEGTGGSSGLTPPFSTASASDPPGPPVADEGPEDQELTLPEPPPPPTDLSLAPPADSATSGDPPASAPSPNPSSLPAQPPSPPPQSTVASGSSAALGATSGTPPESPSEPSAPPRPSVRPPVAPLPTPARPDPSSPPTSSSGGSRPPPGPPPEVEPSANPAPTAPP